VSELEPSQYRLGSLAAAAEDRAAVTPVEERIDHARAREIAEDVLTSQKELDESKWGGYVWEHLGDAWSSFATVARAYLALALPNSDVLIHSHYWACGCAAPNGSGERCGKPVGHEPSQHVSVEGSEWRAALPATEPAQPEEER
jgi:hypothetical protein